MPLHSENGKRLLKYKETRCHRTLAFSWARGQDPEGHAAAMDIFSRGVFIPQRLQPARHTARLQPGIKSCQQKPKEELVGKTVVRNNQGIQTAFKNSTKIQYSEQPF